MQNLRRGLSTRQGHLLLPSPSFSPGWRAARGDRLFAKPWISPPQSRRSFGLKSLPAVLIPPVVFGGLLITLWTYKCLMMVIFQNKIIYMPGVPPFSRSEKLADYAAQCKPVDWNVHDLKSGDGTKIKLLEGVFTGKLSTTKPPRLVVVYFQGNASSSPPRLPFLSNVMKAAAIDDGRDSLDIRLIALSYRGFWTSSGSPSQAGIELDAQAALSWVLKRYDAPTTKIVIWGQSIGAGVASLAVARLARDEQRLPARISGLLLETPFVDVRSMLVALYPQKYLPYRYLAPFLMSTWDSKTALQSIGDHLPVSFRVGLLQAGSDEIVPDGQALILKHVCAARGLDVDHHLIPGALHTEVMMKPQGRRQIVAFLRQCMHST